MTGFQVDADGAEDKVLKGATDGTQIGNVSDSLKVSATFPTVQEFKEVEYPTFFVMAEAVQIGLNKSMSSLVNATGSGVVIRIREIRLVNMQNSAVTGIIADFRVFRCTGHSGGTSLTPNSHDTIDSLSSSVTARHSATISGEGTGLLRHWEWSTDEWSPGAPDVESSDHALQVLIPVYSTQPKTKPITIRPGQGITIKQIINSTVGTFDVWWVFTQEPE
jgi:hypothetical protein